MVDIADAMMGLTLVIVRSSTFAGLHHFFLRTKSAHLIAMEVYDNVRSQKKKHHVNDPP